MIETPRFEANSIKNNGETLQDLVRKGNERLKKRDPHCCCFCGRIFASRQILRNHMETIHCKTKKMFCDHCPKEFHVKNIIVNHMRVHIKKTFSCNICDYKTAFKNNFELHKGRHAVKSTCLVCKKPVASLKTHMLTHKPKVPCPICQKLLAKYYMKEHVKSHVGRSIKCDNCDEVLGSKGELRKYEAF